MQRALSIAAIIVLSLVGLLITGIIDEDYILLYIGLLGTSADQTAATVEQAIVALTEFNLKGLGSISAPLLRAALGLYVLRSVAYFVAAVLMVLWLLPILRKAFENLRRLDPAGTVDTEARQGSPLRYDLMRALRIRAARKRAEAFAALGAALLGLAVGIGFLTRDHGSQRPEVLDDVAQTDDALSQAETLLSEENATNASANSDLQSREDSLIELVTAELAKDTYRRPADVTQANSGLLAALLARDTKDRIAESPDTSKVALEYVAFARAQLDLINRQGEVEALQRIILIVTTKIGSVILILALAHVLIGLYRRGIDLSVQYDGMADAIQLVNREITSDLSELRAALTPLSSSSRSSKVPRSLLSAVEKLVSERGAKDS